MITQRSKQGPSFGVQVEKSKMLEEQNRSNSFPKNEESTLQKLVVVYEEEGWGKVREIYCGAEANLRKNAKRNSDQPLSRYQYRQQPYAFTHSRSRD